MIASWRGLAVAAALGVVLAILVAIDLGRTPGVVDRALVPGFDPDRATELVWERAGQPAIRVVRAGDGWEVRTPSRADPDAASHVPADPGVIGDVLAALRGARWHRRGEPVPVHTTLAVVAGPTHHVLGIGAPIAGTEQTWIVADGRGVVVDRWVARALDRELFALRIKAPLTGIHRARTILVEGHVDGNGGERVHMRIDGNPRRLDAPGGFVIAAGIAGEIERALGDIAIVRIPDGPSAAHGLTITISDEGSPHGAGSAVTVVLGGSCPGAHDLVAVSGTVGDGCIESAAAAAVDRAIGQLLRPPEAVVERRPIPFEPMRIMLADTVLLDTTAVRVGDHPAEPARVAELLAALAAPAEVVRRPARPAAQHLVVTGRTGAAITLELFAEHVLARPGEPVALRPAPGAWRLLVRPSRELRDPTLWLEEPTTITAVRIDRVRYQRGAILGDWTRQPAGGPGTTSGKAPGRAVDTKTLEALVGLLAAPRSLGFVDDQVPAVHRVTLTITPPAGDPTEHVLVLGAPRAAGCPARIDRDTILLPAAVCAQVAALAN
jgi:hypothetical protein